MRRCWREPAVGRIRVASGGSACMAVIHTPRRCWLGRSDERAGGMHAARAGYHSAHACSRHAASQATFLGCRKRHRRSNSPGRKPHSGCDAPCDDVRRHACTQTGVRRPHCRVCVEMNTNSAAISTRGMWSCDSELSMSSPGYGSVNSDLLTRNATKRKNKRQTTAWRRDAWVHGEPSRDERQRRIHNGQQCSSLWT